jgi:hypothetical protein
MRRPIGVGGRVCGRSDAACTLMISRALYAGCQQDFSSAMEPHRPRAIRLGLRLGTGSGHDLEHTCSM